MRTMKLSDIKIKDSFTWTTPRADKVVACREYWKKHHRQDKPILINEDNVLVDGYIRYLVLKEYGEEMAIVRLLRKHNSANSYRNMPTTYVYGIHVKRNSEIPLSSKEYVWRVPNKWDGWEDDIRPGDKILVHTKYGNKTIMVTKIQRLDKCPVSLPVKRVCAKLAADTERDEAIH